MDMPTIEIDFEVFKALTMQREAESISYNDVIRGLLGTPRQLGTSWRLGWIFRRVDMQGRPISRRS